MPGMTEWRIPLSEFQVRAQGTKVYNKRRACPADFVPGQEATWFIVPGSATPIAEMAHAPAPVVPQHSRGKHAMSGVALSAPRPKRHRANSDMSEASHITLPVARRVPSEESINTVPTTCTSLSACTNADSVYSGSSCQGSNGDSDLELEIELLDSESVSLFGLDEQGAADPNNSNTVEGACTWLDNLPEKSEIEDFCVDVINMARPPHSNAKVKARRGPKAARSKAQTGPPPSTVAALAPPLEADKDSSNTCEAIDELWVDVCDKQPDEAGWTSSGEFPFQCLDM